MTRTCSIPGCRREPRYPDLSRCDEHLVRWTPGASVERPAAVQPEWVRRALAHQLPGKALAA